MNVKIINESGYEAAIKGIGFSYGIDDFERLEGVAKKLAFKGGGHNKFLESIQVWIEIRAARYWWAEADTYRAGMTKQSESTIHTIAKRSLTQNDFEHEVLQSTIDYVNSLIVKYNKSEDVPIRKHHFNLIKANLPEGYLQKRMVCTNYKTLKNMIYQRKNHRLQEWHVFIKNVRSQLEHPNLLFEEK
jgi:hypothetical protein